VAPGIDVPLANNFKSVPLKAAPAETLVSVTSNKLALEPSKAIADLKDVILNAIYFLLKLR
jgi:hypothetical protein